MIEKKCIGCGVELQHEDKNGIGYVPEEKFISEENLLCQRCFKIKNYGTNIENPFGKEDYNKVVKDAINGSNIILPIFDIIGFEGSFSEEILDYLRDYRSIVLINKIDLLPGYIHPTEIADWVKSRLAEESIIPDQISFLSTKSKYGINGVIKKISNMFGENKVRAVIFGATNVGKSSLINFVKKLLSDFFLQSSIIFLGKEKTVASRSNSPTVINPAQSIFLLISSISILLSSSSKT